MARFDLTDFEWGLIQPVLPDKPRGVARVDDRRVLNGIFWVLRTGSPWRDLPAEFGKWSSVYRQLRRWTLAGSWEQILEVLCESRIVPDALQMIDSTVVRAHHQAAGAKGGLRDRVSAVREVASRPRSTSASTARVCP